MKSPTPLSLPELSQCHNVPLQSCNTVYNTPHPPEIPVPTTGWQVWEWHNRINLIRISGVQCSWIWHQFLIELYTCKLFWYEQIDKLSRHCANETATAPGSGLTRSEPVRAVCHVTPGYNRLGSHVGTSCMQIQPIKMRSATVSDGYRTVTVGFNNRHPPPGVLPRRRQSSLEGGSLV